MCGIDPAEVFPVSQCGPSLGKVGPAPAHLVVLAAVFGLTLVALTAPFQAPDEPQHFLRAYQISEGGIFPRYRRDRGGGELPVSLTEVSHRFARIRFTYKAKTSLEEIREALRVPLRPRDCQFIPFVTAIYSPVAYIPQATAFWIGRKFELPPLALMYMGRIANLIAWVAFGYVALCLARLAGDRCCCCC